MKCLPILAAALLAALPLCSQDPPKARTGAIEKKLDDLLNRVNLSDEAQLRQAKDLVKNERLTWRGTRIEADVQALLAKLNASLHAIVGRRMLLAQLEGIEAKLAEGTTIEILGRQFEAIRNADLAEQATQEGSDQKARYDNLVRTVTQRYVDSLRKAATAAAQSTTGAGLAPFGLLEDTLRTVIDAATITNDLETQQSYRPKWKQVYKEANSISGRLFDAAYRSRVPWVDLLADSAGWGVVTSSSFQHKFAGSLTLTNEADGATGGLHYQEGDRWRDYVIDMEFEIDAGSFAFYTRIGDRMDSKEVPAFTAGTKRNPNVLFDYGKVYSMQISTIGDLLIVVLDGTVAYSDQIMSSKSRVGEPGIAVSTGTNMTITRLKVRHLR